MPLVKSDIASLVKRTTTVRKLGGSDKKTPMFDPKTKAPLFETKEVPVKTADVLDFKVHDDNTVTVVTTDGQKLTAPLPEALVKKLSESNAAK